jgi:hypothetical protein
MARKVPRPFKYEWGSGSIVEEASWTGEHMEPAIQLLRYEGGEADGMESVRFCFYNLKGAWQRHPLMLSAEDAPQVREALEGAPRLRQILREMFAEG